jgi:LPXTG-motif cell wall-anchored protein
MAAAAPSGPAATSGGDYGSADGLGAAASAPTSVGIAAAPSTGQITKQETTSTTSVDGSSGPSWSPLLIVSAIALVLGVALLVLARRRENELR